MNILNQINEKEKENTKYYLYIYKRFYTRSQRYYFTLDLLEQLC